ncbi:peptidoglycan DD-metalloendopeptidase family protein [Winogradskyella bathintestinalis]|uniref:Peptidoglycan DD-metalloendopeptidase family protein n=1 Tax=Winogradskyella bathintestinalis TaxID=3035208 RepID=A0ABT7ZU18_9FLAO|nr:peptidoglycan DD-metalloendopeptidase family protein [Winogradskyella bathintestinalis]MDN3492461.1 peptidoglycan DD-metalloendopeptidase family protein [Winogradskyella bathintestinalis]
MSVSNFEGFLKSFKPHPLVDSSISPSDFIHINLSLHNFNLSAVDISSSNELQQFIWKYIAIHQAKVAYGGYLEQRGIYRRSTYFNRTNHETERNIHLGLDLWSEANTPIFAPLNGTIHSFKNNTNHGGYGPTIILKHDINDVVFYTLYGHLSLESLWQLEVGVEVKQGEQIATLGTAEVNGDYPPHLHFQIIRDIQNYKGDYPGVCSKQGIEFYKQNCPDPNLLLKI